MIHKKKKFSQLYERAKEVQRNSFPANQAISYDEIYKIIDDYQLYQIELELQNDELQRAILSYEEEHARYTDLYDFIPFGYFTLNQQGAIVEANEMGANLLGIKKSHLINKNLSRYVAPNFQHLYMAHLQDAFDSYLLKSCEIKLLRKNGPLFFAQLDTKAVVNPITKKSYLITFVKDITDRKQQEHYLFEYQQKVASVERDNSMGEFAEIITHELNHPLAVIANYLHGCIRRLESEQFQPRDIINALRQAANQSHRVTEIILRMKNFTCKGTMNFEVVNINDLINESISLLNYEASPTFPVRIVYYPINKPAPLKLDKIHIEQVIINLARNAIEAMRDASVSDPSLIIEAIYSKTDQIEISISDNGPGILEENLHKLFNPYFTTKTYGVGLGLAVSKKIIEAHGGSFTVESLATKGTCFKFTLLTNLEENISTTISNKDYRNAVNN